MLNAVLSVALGVVCLLSVIPPGDAAPAGPLAQVIEGAKKEGTVTVKLTPGFTQKSMSRLEKEIKDRYGVDLSIKFTPSTKFTNDVAEAIMEQKAGAVPSFDLLTLSNHIATANQAGVLEDVDWKLLLSQGTNPNVAHDTPLMRGGIVYHTAYFGLMYNPEKIKANEVPRTLADLANPKWKGRGGIETSANSWLRWSFLLGRDKVLSGIRAILKNEAIQGRYVDLLNRYLIGEIQFCTISSEFIVDAKEKGMPTGWQTLDIGDVREYALVVRKGASHPNAAKLLALYIASPEGAAFAYEGAKYGTLYYPGNYEHEIRLQNQKQGIPDVFGDRRPDLLEFYTSKEASQLEKEIGLILQTGGR
jgi:iron(III) transport system substrate-binding protein